MLYYQVCKLFFRSVQSVNTIDEEAAADTSLNVSVLGGVLGVIIVILTLLLVVTLFGMLHMYRKMQQTKMNRKRTLSRYNYRSNNCYYVCFTVPLTALQMHQNMSLITQLMEKMNLLVTTIILWKMELNCIAELVHTMSPLLENLTVKVTHHRRKQQSRSQKAYIKHPLTQYRYS